LLDRRRALSTPARDAADAAIVERVSDAIEAWRSASDRGPSPVLGAWWPIRGEPSLLSGFSRWIANGWRIALPVVVAADSPLVFRRWTPQTTMVEGDFRVPVPAHGDALQPHLLLIPCVGFDVRGWRLGYGGGYYDRTLSTAPVAAIGIGYDCSEIEGFAPAGHDRRLEALITETRHIPSCPFP
jgi:5,10-methenyltetrahydrofolate synthetase